MSQLEIETGRIDNRLYSVQLKLDPATIIAAAPGANVVPTGSRDRASAL